MTSSTDPFDALEPITLVALDEVAALQTRVDRKYIVGPGIVDALVHALSDATRVLDIGGRHSFDYRSVYFDTPDLDAYMSAARRRRHRWKVRTRTYVDTGDCMLEVKTRNGRGDTVKSRLDHGDDDMQLTPEGRSFIHGATDRLCAVDELRPTLATVYRRTTLVDLEAGTRLTVDRDLECTDWGPQRATVGDLMVVETKSPGSPSPADRWLWNHHVRPTKVSKFCTGLAALHPELPDNKWHRTLERHWTVI